MTYSEASKIVQDYTGEPLLESLERIQDRLHEPSDCLIMSTKVKVAYYTLMAGFTELLAPPA